MVPGNKDRLSFTLHVRTTFWTRLLGLHAIAPLSEHEGLYLSPCQTIHTFGLRFPIDVVFVDACLVELKRVDSLKMNRIAGCWKARAVIELPAGYCSRHSDYLHRIRQALGTQFVDAFS